MAKASKKTVRNVGKLSKIAEMVECSYHLSYNAHKDVYETPENYYSNSDIFDEADVKALNFEEGIWDLRIYDKTPIGFYLKVSNDLEEIIDWGLNLLEERKAEEVRRLSDAK